MFDFINLNYGAVTAALLICLFVGSFWYSPKGFGRQWSKLSGVDIMKLPQQEANRAIMYVALSSALQVFVLAVVIRSLGSDTFLEGFVTGVTLWAGLTAATTVGTTFYSRKGWHFWWLNASFFLVVIPVNAVIFSLWR